MPMVNPKPRLMLKHYCVWIKTVRVGHWVWTHHCKLSATWNWACTLTVFVSLIKFTKARAPTITFSPDIRHGIYWMEEIWRIHTEQISTAETDKYQPVTRTVPRRQLSETNWMLRRPERIGVKRGKYNIPKRKYTVSKHQLLRSVSAQNIEKLNPTLGIPAAGWVGCQNF